jgi:hypothetical protein
MANLVETDEFPAGIYQLETSDPVMGGEEGIDNLQAKQLAARTMFLRQRLIELGIVGANVDAALVRAALSVSSTTQMNTAITTAVNELINAAPGALNTLDELAAALGDDANFAATITAALALKSPLLNPVFTGASGDSPAQFDNSGRLATTGFLKQRGVEYAGSRVINAATVLTAADAGKHLLIGSSGGYTVTLPSLATFPDGAIIDLSCYVTTGTADVTIQRAGADVIVSWLGVNGPNLTMRRGQNLKLMKSLTAGAGSTPAWVAVEGTARGDHGATMSTTSAIIYDPSGLIIQMMYVTFVATNALETFSLPMSFPNGFIGVLGTDSNPNVAASVSFQRNGLGQVDGKIDTGSGGTFVVAFGY